MKIGSIIKFIVVILYLINISSNILFAQNPEDILAKHLDSIGTEANRKIIRSRMIAGTSKATFRGRGAGLTEGITVLASEGEKNLIGMKFSNADYPFEMMGYDGNHFSAKQLRPGVRSVLGNFLRMHENIFKGGIMGGALSHSWVLLNFDEKKGRLKYEGIVNAQAKRLHKISFFPKKGSDLEIKFFFDTETFQHTKTEYKRILSSSIGSGVDNSARQSETRYTLIEEFSDFKEEQKLTLPHNYQLFLEIISGNGTVSYEWKMELKNFVFNERIEPNQFNVESY